MSTPTNDGGPAFPLQEYGDSRSVSGMSLRDYFAAKALTGIIASPDSQSWGAKIVADHAYAFADAMLAARNQTTK